MTNITIDTKESNTQTGKLKPFVVDPQRHVKMWFSKDGIPEKHQVRFIKFRILNPDATLHLLYAEKYLTSAGRENITNFAKLLNIRLVEYETIKPVGADEKAIKASIDQELEYYFTKVNTQEKGNLSVVADRLRLFENVLTLGIQSDCDVEFNVPLPKAPITATLGIFAKTRNGVDGDKGGIRISNDLIAGDPKHPVFITTKKLLCEHIKKYHTAVPIYLKRHGIRVDSTNYDNHPGYFRARNERLSAFSLGGGPQIFAIALHINGIITGYENITAPEIFLLEDNLALKPYIFVDATITQQQAKKSFALLLPEKLRKGLVAGWDHSWRDENVAWKRLDLNHVRILGEFKMHVAQSSLTKTPSQLRSFFAHLTQSNLSGRRHREFSELPKDVQTYIRENETPNLTVRETLARTLGADFKEIASTFSSDGVLILPGYFKGKQLENLQAAFAGEIAKKNPHPFLKQAAFNASVDSDGVAFETMDTVLEAATNANLQALIKFHFGQNQVVAAMRGYRQHTTPPLLYRAWDYHQDLKTKGPFGEIKIMILLNGVKAEGQSMRLLKATHLQHWHADTQQQTKYTLDECLGYAKDGCVTVCHGIPGTVILFDTNALHSGHRNEHDVRDIFTISYAPDSKDAPIMHAKFAAKKADTINQEYKADDKFWKNMRTTNGTLSKAATAILRDEYYSTPIIEQLKDRYQPTGVTKFKNFLVAAISIDVNGDLDLRLRKGKEDTIRDNQLIAFRDVSSTHEQYQRVASRIKQQKTTISYDINLDAMRHHAKLAGNYKNHKQTSVSHCAIFALDLLDAFQRIDSRQRLRTTMAYLYFTLDRIDQLTHDATICNSANHVLYSYTNTVYLDDLEYGLNSNFDKTQLYCVPELFKPGVVTSAASVADDSKFRSVVDGVSCRRNFFRELNMPNETDEKHTKPSLKDINFAALQVSYRIANTDQTVAKNPHFLGHGTIPKPTFILAGDGADIVTDKGKVIDFSAMVVNCVLGQNDPWVNAHLITYLQSGRPSYTSVSLGGHELYYKFPQRLAQLRIGGMSNPVFNFRQCNGSDVVESAILAAWSHKKEKKRSLLISFKGSFHGQNLTSFMASALLNNNVFLVNKPDNIVFLDTPPHAVRMGDEKLTLQESAVIEQLKVKAQDAFAVLIEPIQMNNAGHTFSKAFLAELNRICNENDICFILDEIQTGMGWLGALTLSEKLGLKPDIITLGKGLTGGNGPLSLMIAQKKYDYLPNCATGKTNGADIRSMVAVNAILDRLLGLPDEKITNYATGQLRSELRTGLLPRVATISQQLDSHLNKLKALFPNNIGEIRGEGVIRWIQILDAQSKLPDTRLASAINLMGPQHGIFVRNNGNFLLIKTPLVITDAELALGFKNLITTITTCLVPKLQSNLSGTVAQIVTPATTTSSSSQVSLMRGLSFLVTRCCAVFQVDDIPAPAFSEVRAALNRL